MVSLKMRGGKVFCAPLAFLVGHILPVYCAAFFVLLFIYKKKELS